MRPLEVGLELKDLVKELLWREGEAWDAVPLLGLAQRPDRSCRACGASTSSDEPLGWRGLPPLRVCLSALCT